MNEAILGFRRLDDGVERKVYLDTEGRQYILDEGRRRFGAWLDPDSAEPDFCYLVSKSGRPPKKTKPTDANTLAVDSEFAGSIKDYKWIESEKVLQNIESEFAIHCWIFTRREGYLRAKLLEHLLGYKFWSEIDKLEFGTLAEQFANDHVLLDRIIDRLRGNQENLEILMWAQEWNIAIDRVVQILEIIDLNSQRLLPR